MTKRFFLTFALVLSLAASALAEGNALAPSSRYGAVVPTIRSVVGYSTGEAFTTYGQLNEYLRAVDGVSDRVRVTQYGTTVEGRPLLTVWVSSPANLDRLDNLRASWNKLGDPRVTSAKDAATIAASTPALVWFTYGMHGNEASSSEAALQLVYELAASEDPQVAKWLDSVVLVIDPVANPDGRERYVNYFRSWMGTRARPDRFAAEHTERWPGGRFNHYLFDLNRDWAWQTQQESQARVKAFRDWSPQVHIDFHEMTVDATYFFAPHAKPVLEPISKNLTKWYEIFGDAVSSAFDKHGFRYFSREAFDLQYPSYGDTWPALNGAVGMTYEQGGGGAGGLVVDLPDAQRTLTLRERVTHHFTASLASLEAAATNREARLRDFHAFRNAAIQAGQSGPVRAIYIEPSGDRERDSAVVNRLLRQGVEVQTAGAEFEALDLTSHWGEKQARRKMPAGTLVIDLAQPLGFLARVLLEREVPADHKYFYDVSAWSIPLVAGSEAYSSPQLTKTELTRLSGSGEADGKVEGSTNPIAYVMAPDDAASLKALAQLLDSGVKAYVSLRPSTLEKTNFPAGTIVVPVSANGPKVHEAVASAVKQSRARATGLATTRASDGVDLGSERVVFMRRPSIAVLTDSPVQPTDYGALWHALEQRYDVPFTPIRTELLRNVDLSKYNVLVLPPDSGDGAGYERAFDKRTADRIATWVRDGGLLIAIRGGAVWATKQKSGLTSVTYRLVRPEEERARIEEERRRKDDKDRPEGEPKSAEKREPDQELAERLTRYADREQRQREQEIAGALIRATVDTSHPLAFGLSERLAVQLETAPVLELSSKGEHAVYFGKDALRLSGFITPENEKKLNNTAYVVRERVGRGAVVLFADTPVFRGYTDATTRLLLNALFFGNIHDPNLQN